MRTPPAGRSPTLGLLSGLIVTLAAVVIYSGYITRQISGLRAMQTDLVDRIRKDSLQLLRIQNDLNTVALAMRDMLDNETGYPLTAWSAQFVRVRADLDDALRREAAVALGSRTAEQQTYLGRSFTQFWDATDRMFALATGGHDDDARVQIQLSLQARQASLSTAIARLLVENNESEDQTARQVQAIYAQAQRQVYWFLGATLLVISLTSLYLIRVNRRLFTELAVLSEGRHELAQQLIAGRESTLREISRELHDEFGQILTAMGSMLGRAGRQVREGTSLRADLREVAEVAQTALDNVRGLSQALHPSILEDAGLEQTIAWYLSTVPRQLGLRVAYAQSGHGAPLDSAVGIHVYRVLQEALTNVARHSGVHDASVRLSLSETAVELEIEDHGAGMGPAGRRGGLGIVTMRERAELVGGTVSFEQPGEGGTLVRFRVPIPGAAPRE